MRAPTVDYRKLRLNNVNTPEYRHLFLLLGWVGYFVLYFLLYSVDSFKKMQTYIIITQIVAMVGYIFFPNRQDLRPEVFPRDNILT